MPSIFSASEHTAHLMYKFGTYTLISISHLHYETQTLFDSTWQIRVCFLQITSPLEGFFFHLHLHLPLEWNKCEMSILIRADEKKEHIRKETEWKAAVTFTLKIQIRI